MDLVFQNLTSDKRYKSNFFEKILVTGVRELKLGDRKIELSVNLVGESKIKELNKKYRRKNKVTDVLSFPMLENFEFRVPARLAGGSNFEFQDLGDIFICLSFAKKQAKEENISIEKELARLTVHGFLHLLGYDHERSKKDEIEMFKLEHKILNRLKI